MNARDVLRLLWANKPKDLQILIWVIQDGVKTSHWRSDPDDAAEVVKAYPNADVYMGIGLSPKNYGPHARCLAAQVAAIGAIWMDIDLASGAHTKPLPKTIEEALKILPPEFPPSLIIFTGNGLHVYWLLKELEIFKNAEDRARVAKVILRWQTLLCQIAATHGWRIDRLADLARVLRPPGTTNWKDRQTPKSVVVHQTSDTRYNLDDFTWFLDQMGIADPDAVPVTSAAVSPVATLPASTATPQPLPGPGLEGDFEIRLNATIPAETIDFWFGLDLNFHQLWLRKRADLNQKSASEYDLAFCNFARNLGLPAQTAVDIIVHNRRLHRLDARTKRYYFERTLDKARTTSLPNRLPPPPSSPVPPAAPAPPETEQVKPAAAAAAPKAGSTTKGVLAQWISEQLGLPVAIARILKITGSEPTYQTEFANGTRITHSEIAGLLDQNRLRWAIAASALNYRIPVFKPIVWNTIADRILESLTEVEGGSENQLTGALQTHIERYLYTTKFIDTEDQSTRTCDWPRIQDGQVAISAEDLRLYFHSRNIRISIREITSALVALGAEQRRIQKQSRDLSRWFLPASDFPPSDYTAHQPSEMERKNQRKPN